MVRGGGGGHSEGGDMVREGERDGGGGEHGEGRERGREG